MKVANNSINYKISGGRGVIFSEKKIRWVFLDIKWIKITTTVSQPNKMRIKILKFKKKYFIPIFSFIWQLIHHLKLSIRCSL